MKNGIPTLSVRFEHDAISFQCTLWPYQVSSILS